MDQAERLEWHLEPGMLKLADRYYGGFPLWSAAQDRGADVLWRVKLNQVFSVREIFPIGSWSRAINGSGRDRRRRSAVREVRYRMPGGEEAFTLITTLLDPEQVPAAKLAVLYHERWEIETATASPLNHGTDRTPGSLNEAPDLPIADRAWFWGPRRLNLDGSSKNIHPSLCLAKFTEEECQLDSTAACCLCISNGDSYNCVTERGLSTTFQVAISKPRTSTNNVALAAFTTKLSNSSCSKIITPQAIANTGSISAAV